MRRTCDTLDRPMMATMSNGGLSPMRTAAELADIGFALAIFPAMTSLIAAAAMEQALRRLKADGEDHPAEMRFSTARNTAA